MRRSLHILAMIVLLVSCSKVSVIVPDSEQICFEVITPESADVTTRSAEENAGAMTKAEVTMSNVASSIRVFGKENASTLWSGGTGLTLNNQRWKPTTAKLWNDASSYIFHAYAYDKGNGSITISDEGKTIKVTQDGTVDYLLSYNASYAPSNTHTLVPLYLEHAMAKVEVYVERAQSMSGKTITITSLSIENVRNDATMVCYYHRPYNASGQNGWSYTFGSSVTSHTVQNVQNESITTESSSPLMSFFAIPVDRTAMNSYTMTIDYTIEGVVYKDSFNLRDYSEGWLQGHKIRYKFVIDNSIHLTGTISDWIEVDYIEGTLTPPVS